MNARENNIFDFFVNYERWSNNSTFYRLTVPLNMLKTVQGVALAAPSSANNVTVVVPTQELNFNALQPSDSWFGFYEYRQTASNNSLGGAAPIYVSGYYPITRSSIRNNSQEGWALINRDYNSWKYGSNIKNNPWLPGRLGTESVIAEPQRYSYTYSVQLYLHDKRTGIKTQDTKNVRYSEFVNEFPANVTKAKRIGEEIVCTLCFNNGPELDTYIVYDTLNENCLYKLCCPDAEIFIRNSVSNEQSDSSLTPSGFEEKYNPLMRPSTGDFSFYEMPGDGSTPVNEYGLFTTTPCICSIKLNIYKNIKIKDAAEDFRKGVSLSVINNTQYYVRGPLIQQMEMNPTFVDVMPAIKELYAYPSQRIYQGAPSLTQITDNNWRTITPGVEFIGEGHTEKITLGCLYQTITKKQKYSIDKDTTVVNTNDGPLQLLDPNSQTKISIDGDYFVSNWFVGNSSVDIGDWDTPSLDKLKRLGISDGQLTSQFLINPSSIAEDTKFGNTELSLLYDKIPYSTILKDTIEENLKDYCPLCAWYGFKGTTFYKAYFKYFNKQNKEVFEAVWDSERGMSWVNPFTPPKFIYSEFLVSKLPTTNLGKRVPSTNSSNTKYSWFNQQIETRAFVNVRSTPNKAEEFPISVRLTDTLGVINLNGPIISYDDQTGIPMFYPFFRSTLDILGRDKLKRTEENIKIRTYPEIEPPKFITPYKDKSFYLAFNSSPTTFRSSIFNVATKHSYIAQEFKGTVWKLGLTSKTGKWFYSTPLLENIATYQYNMTYSEAIDTGIIPTFTAPVYTPSNVTISATSYKNIWINAPPYDWVKKTLVHNFADEATVMPSPFLGLKFYTPNYFNLREQEIPIFVIKGPSFMMDLESLTLEGDNVVSPIEFNREELQILSGADTQGVVLSGILKFSKSGIVNLRVKGTLKTNRSLTSKVFQELEINFPDFVEIVKYFDKVDEKYFNSNLVPLQLTVDKAPVIAPNELVLADTINNVIGTLWDCIEDINEYTKIYTKKTKFYGWMGPEEQFRLISPYAAAPINDWEDLATVDNQNYPTWELFESPNTNTVEKTWAHHSQSQDQTVQDPSCNQKYCLDWRWYSRKKKNSKTAIVTWANTKLGKEYAKRWNYEPCENSNSVLNCNKSTWKISTTDVDSFPPTCMVRSRCAPVDVKMLYSTDKIIVGYQTEINILDTDYAGTLLGRTSIADENFAFKNIVSIAHSSTGKLFVLDGALTKVVVFSINQDSFQLERLDSWGTYGIGEDPREMNNPHAIFVDDQEFVWIADTNNFKIKKFNIFGKHISTISSQMLLDTPPIGMDVDSKNNLHVLTKTRVLVFNLVSEKYLYQYSLRSEIGPANNISASFNREMFYITGVNGIAKYYRTGKFCYFPSIEEPCGTQSYLKGYVGITQDKYRNVYVCTMDKLLKIPDLQHPLLNRAYINEDLYWDKEQLLIHKEEFVQDWVYLKSFHRLWDNVELLRNSLFYSQKGCETYTPPVYTKEELILGQNEILTNSVINRLSKQIWENILSLARFFKYRCE